MKEYVKKAVPHLLAVLLFLGLTVVYFAPIVFENKDLVQGDIRSGSAWGKDLKDYHEQTGEYAFWSNSMFSGMPANYTFPPPLYNVFSYIGKIVMLNLSIFHIGLIFLYLLGFYIFMLSIGCKQWLSIIGAIAYTFASYNVIIIEAGHVNQVLVMATMAPVIGGIILTYRKKYVWGSIVTLVFTGLNVYWGHQQISYYLLIMLLVLAVVYLIYAIKEKTLKDYFTSSALLLVVAVFAVAPESGKLITIADYTKETMRGGAVLQNNEEGKKESSGLDIDYAFMWSYGKGETMTLLIPNFYGGGSANTVSEDSEVYSLIRKAGYNAESAGKISASYLYWGDQPGTNGPVYMGAIICFLFVLGLMIVKGPEKWWIVIATMIGIAMAWGRHFPIVNDFLFYHLPLYNKFRTPAMSLAIAEVTMAALAILALKEILDNQGNRKKYLKPAYIAAGITGGLCLLYALLGSSLMSFSRLSEIQTQSQSPEFFAAIMSDRKSLLSSDAWRSFIFIALAMGTLWYYIHKPFKTTYVIAIIGILVFIDLWTVSKRFLSHDSLVFQKNVREFVATPVDELILRDKDPNYRVLNLASDPFQEAATSYFHKSIGGYHPAKLRRYQDIIDFYLSKEINMNILNMLNTRYVIVSSNQGPQVQPNAAALGNSWFVSEIQWVNSPDEEIAALKKLNPAQTAVIDAEWKEKIPGWERLHREIADSMAFIALTDYAGPGNLIYESSAMLPHLAVFSEVYYKTWHAYIDGVEAPLIRVNYILRGLEIPAGNHTIEFKCIDDLYQQSAKISLIASIITGILLVCLFGFALWCEIRVKV